MLYVLRCFNPFRIKVFEMCSKTDVTIKTSTNGGGGTDFHNLEIGLLSAIGVGILILLVWRCLPYLYRQL